MRIGGEQIETQDGLAGERGVLRGLLTRSLRLNGPPRLLKSFARCFPR